MPAYDLRQSIIDLRTILEAKKAAAKVDKSKFAGAEIGKESDLRFTPFGTVHAKKTDKGWLVLDGKHKGTLMHKEKGAWIVDKAVGKPAAKKAAAPAEKKASGGRKAAAPAKKETVPRKTRTRNPKPKLSGEAPIKTAKITAAPSGGGSVMLDPKFAKQVEKLGGTRTSTSKQRDAAARARAAKAAKRGGGSAQAAPTQKTGGVREKAKNLARSALSAFTGLFKPRSGGTGGPAQPAIAGVSNL